MCPVTVLCPVHVSLSVPQLYGLGTVLIFSLFQKRLRPREVKELVQSHTGNK